MFHSAPSKSPSNHQSHLVDLISSIARGFRLLKDSTNQASSLTVLFLGKQQPLTGQTKKQPSGDATSDLIQIWRIHPGNSGESEQILGQIRFGFWSHLPNRGTYGTSVLGETQWLMFPYIFLASKFCFAEQRSWHKAHSECIDAKPRWSVTLWTWQEN